MNHQDAINNSEVISFLSTIARKVNREKLIMQELVV